MKTIFVGILMLFVVFLSACGNTKENTSIDNIQEKKLGEGKKMKVKGGEVINTGINVDKTETSTGFIPNN